MPTLPTIRELLQQGLVAEADVHAAITVCLSAPTTMQLPIGEAYRLNLGNMLKPSTFSG